MGRLFELAHRIRRRLFDSRSRAMSDSESYAGPLCQCRLQIQDHPLDIFAGEYLVPYQTVFEVTPRPKTPGSFMIADFSRHQFIEFRVRNDVLCPEIREIWSLDGKRRIVFACRKRWSKEWTLYLPSGATLCHLSPSSGGYTATLDAQKEILSIQTHCTCGGPCFNFHRGDNHHAGRTIASALSRSDKVGFQIVIAPFVDVLLIIAVASCVWKVPP